MRGLGEQLADAAQDGAVVKDAGAWCGRRGLLCTLEGQELMKQPLQDSVSPLKSGDKIPVISWD